MQGDGNLVLYAPGMSARWQSGTSGHPGAWSRRSPAATARSMRLAALLLERDGHAGAGPASLLQVQDDGGIAALYNSSPRPARTTGTFWYPSAIVAQAALVPGGGLLRTGRPVHPEGERHDVEFTGPAGREGR